MNDTIEGEVARYATAVRAAFADVPGPERELLLEDLEDHLQEVAAEADGPLSERLGAPEAYAAELRASAGLPAAGPGTGPGGRRRTRGRLRDSRVAHRLERLWRGAQAHPAGGAIVGFLPELRPAWWVLRGYLAVQLAAIFSGALVSDDGLRFPVPLLLNSQVLGLLAVVAAVAGSVALGRRPPAGRGSRWLRALANLVLGLFAVTFLFQLGVRQAHFDRYPPEYVVDVGGAAYGLRADGREITNIHPFDADGRPLQDVYLVDQDGNPLVATHGDRFDLEPQLPLDRDGNQVDNRYPQKQYAVDPTTGRRRPEPAPRFEPPPGPVRSP